MFRKEQRSRALPTAWRHSETFLRRAEAIQIFLKVCVPIAIPISPTVGRVVWIQAMRRLPGVRHSIVISIGRSRTAHQRRPTADLILRVNQFAPPSSNIIDYSPVHCIPAERRACASENEVRRIGG